MRSREPVTVLVYDATDAKAYAALVSAKRARVRVVACATPAEAAAAIAEAEVLYAWKFPPELFSRAPRLSWLQVMGAGADWALVPTLPAGVIVTRMPGIFGPWMREYVLAWCLSITQRTETYRAAQRERRWRQELLPDRLG